ncbi:MAG: hypothetical protein HYR85_02260 [Planctomycetes bacterium]|nr:hypothetical protein [Planctomycetota bacterium]MBI3848415.1 hypothetical protein [Planctomycetota bacterium]
MSLQTLKATIVAAALFVVVLAGFGIRPVCASAAIAPDAAQAQRVEKLRAAGTKASLALYPVQVVGQPNTMVAEVLGLVLEGSGMNNLDAVDVAFVPPADVTWDRLPASFGEFLRKSPPKSDYALYAQYLGDPRTGPTEVRFVVTDSAGNVVLTDVQTPKDADFMETAQRDPDPMGCSVLVARRLFTQMGWKKSEGEPKEDGKFARRWAAKSGTPTEAERAAMAQRAKKLTSDLSHARIGVYATLTGNTTNAESAARLANLIAERFGCQTVKLDDPVHIEIQPSSNEQKRLWDLARAFREQLRAQPAKTDYALLADMMIDPAGGPAHAVHFVVCEKSGEWVIVDFQNDQHEDFQRLSPRSLVDCEQLAVERLGRYVK